MEKYSVAGNCIQYTVWPSRNRSCLGARSVHLSVMDFVHITLHLPREDCRAPEKVKSITNTVRFILEAHS